jgi:hypothetical protein
MGDRQPLNIKTIDTMSMPRRHLKQRHLFEQSRPRQFWSQQCQRKGGCIDGTTQARPQIGHRAHVILVRMGNEQCRQTVAAFFDKAWIRHLHARPRLTVACKCNTAIDHEPTLVVAVEIEVHANLAGSAKRQKPEVFVTRYHDALTRLYCGAGAAMSCSEIIRSLYTV